MHVLEARFLLSGKWRKIRDTNATVIAILVFKLGVKKFCETASPAS